MRSGWIDLDSGHSRSAGIYGYDRSKFAGANGELTSRYELYFNNNGVYPSNGPRIQWGGIPLRYQNQLLFTLDFFEKTKPLFDV